MCGIAGMVGFEEYPGQDRAVLERMLATLQRRGPDQEGIYTDDCAAMLHRRLAVIDIENGKQPMSYICGNRKYVMVYNGELYNTEELRKELLQKGYTFCGHSDTEVLLKSYVEWGEGCLQKLNGIFAFAVWCVHTRTLFFARDRMGVKPLFYTCAGNQFIFGSQLKTLLAHPAVEPLLDSDGIAEIMLVGPGRTPGCGIFKNVFEVPAAHCGTYTPKGLELHAYWQLKDRAHTDTLEQTVEKVRFLVTDAITRQLVSDVPVCTFLSGGLDSSLISSVADRYFTQRGQQLHTFSVTYRDNDKFFRVNRFQPTSDTEYIVKMNGYLNATHHDIIIETPELVDALYAAVDANDLPGMADVDASMLLLCRAIKEQGTVALSGECADEIFGGYPWYTDTAIRMQEGFPWAQSTLYRAGFLTPELSSVINARQYVGSRYTDTVGQTDKIEGLSAPESRMKEMVKLNMDWFMQTLLTRKDRMSMYSGLEVRVPFCDWRIAEYMYSVPWEFKHADGMEKGLLRKAAEGLLPDEVLWRKKSPYPKTHNPAYLAAVTEQLNKILQNPNEPIFAFVRKNALENLINLNGYAQPWYGQLMMQPQTIAYFLQVNYWLKKYHVRIA